MKIKHANVLFAIILGLTSGCSAATTTTTPSSSASSSTAATYTAGTYEGSGEGRGGTITVSLTLSDDAISDIEVVSHSETPGISDYALETIPQEVIEYQSLAIDSVSGATLTSRGLISAITDALENAGVDVDALEQVDFDYPTMATDDLTTQVVVAGGGMSGLMAAATAAYEGADVILVEKQPYVGGSLILAGGGFATANSEVIHEMGADDSLERIMDYFRMVNETSTIQPDYDFVEYMLSQTGVTIDFMNEVFDMEPTYSDRGDYIRTNFGEGWQEVETLLSVLENENVTVLTDTRATQILMEDGQASGLHVENRDGEYDIHANEVIIATGGASYDTERLHAAVPQLDTVSLSEQAIRSNEGDGFAMLEAVGAQMSDDLRIKDAYPDFSLVFRFTWRNNPSVANQLVIDDQGNRFYNESPYNSMMLNHAMIMHDSPAYYAIYDGVNIDSDLLALFDQYIDQDNPNIVVHGDTIEELAEKLNIDVDTLTATMENYQAACESGVDDEYGKTSDHLIAYDDTNGYYAAYLQPASWGTLGGAITDENFRVVDQSNTVIPNLYAVGECATSTLFGDYYLGGFSLGYYSTAGRLAAQDAVSALSVE